MPDDNPLEQLHCPGCGSLALDLDDGQAHCGCGATWEIDPDSECWIPVLLQEIDRLRWSTCNAQCERSSLLLSLESRDMEVAEYTAEVDRLRAQLALTPTHPDCTAPGPVEVDEAGMGRGK